MGVICFLLLLTYFKICRCISNIGSLQKCSVFRALKVQSAGMKKYICWCFLQKLCLAVYLLRFCQIKLFIYKQKWNIMYSLHNLQQISSLKVQDQKKYVDVFSINKAAAHTYLFLASVWRICTYCCLFAQVFTNNTPNKTNMDPNVSLIYSKSSSKLSLPFA